MVGGRVWWSPRADRTAALGPAAGSAASLRLRQQLVHRARRAHRQLAAARQRGTLTQVNARQHSKQRLVYLKSIV